MTEKQERLAKSIVKRYTPKERGKRVRRPKRYPEWEIIFLIILKIIERLS